MTRRPTIAVIGDGVADAAVEAAAFELGRRIVDAGWRLVCGGRGGVMAAACRGARASEAWVEGTTVGILPGTDGSQANPWVDVVVPTGMGLARNVLVVLAGDVVVAVGGGSGTLSELALAWQHERPIVALDVDVGWSSRLAGTVLDARQRAPIARAVGPQDAVRLVAEALTKGSPAAS